MADNYTRGAYSSLPGTAGDLTTSYSSQDYIDVSSINSVFVLQAATNQIPIHQFKKTVGAAASGSWTFTGKSNVACSTNPIKLEKWKVVGSVWESAAENTTAAIGDTVTLTATIPATADYLDSGVITFRVYQSAVTETVSWLVGGTRGVNLSTGFYVPNSLYGSAVGTEGYYALRISAPGTFRNFWAQVSAAPGASGTRTATWSKGSGTGGGASQVALNFGTADTLLSNTSTTFSVVADDFISLYWGSTGTPNAAYARWGFEFVPTTTNQTNIHGGAGAALSTTATQYLGFAIIGASTAPVYFVAPCPGRISKLYAYLTSAPAGEATRTFGVNVNSQDVSLEALKVTIAGANQTGNEPDDYVDVVAGDLVCFSSEVSATAPAASRAQLGVTFTPTNTGDFILSLEHGNYAINTGAESYAPVNACLAGAWSTTVAEQEAFVGGAVGASFNAKAIYVVGSAAPGAGATCDLALNLNTVDNGTLKVTLSGAGSGPGVTTGNASGTVAIAMQDLIAFSCVPSSSPAPAAVKYTISLCCNGL